MKLTDIQYNPTRDLQDSVALQAWWPDIFRHGRPRVRFDGTHFLLWGSQGNTAVIAVHDVPDHIRPILNRLSGV